MRINFRKSAALLLIAAMATPAVFAQTAATPPSKKVRHGKTAVHKETIAEQLRQMHEMMVQQQQEMQQQKQQIQALQEQIQQAQQAAQQAQTSATQATSKASDAAQQASTAQQATESVQNNVKDLQASATTTASEIKEGQTQFKKMVESPLAIHYKGITLTPGGFLAAETVYRSKGLASDINTPFGTVPFLGAGNAHTSEFFGSGRQSRVTLLAEGKVSNAKLRGYYEADWLSAAVTSNNNQSNSYSMRQRQLYAQVAFDNGWQLTGGQMWSLLTETKSGLENRTEALPMTIDPQYSVGFSWARQYGFRVSKAFNKKVFVGFAVENPQVNALSAANAPNNFFWGNLGTAGGLYNSTAVYSYNPSPDYVAKIAFEPGFGHYEIFGVASDFRDRIYPTAGSTVGAFNKSHAGGGIGANARVSLFQKHVDVGAHFLGGSGVGRYGTAGLPDLTVRPDGTLALIKSYQGLGTLEWHSKYWDIYGNGGAEYAGRNYRADGTGKLVGYGVPTADNSGCDLETLPGSGTAPGAAAKCAGATRSVVEASFGFWLKLYSGDKGHLQFGPQYSKVYRNLWRGVGGAPAADENMFLTSFRYYLP